MITMKTTKIKANNNNINKTNFNKKPIQATKLQITGKAQNNLSPLMI